MDFLHPANAEELANIARENGAEVLRGPLRYPSETGGWQLGDLGAQQALAMVRSEDFAPSSVAFDAAFSAE